MLSTDPRAGPGRRGGALSTPGARGGGSNGGLPPREVGSGASADDDDENLLDDEGLIGKKRSRAPRKTFRESDLLSAKGLWLLYDEMQNKPAISRAKGKEVS